MKITELFGKKDQQLRTNIAYPSGPPPPEQPRANGRTLNTFLVVIAIAGLALGGFYYYKYQQLKNTSPGAAGQAEAKDLVTKVSRLMILPSGELPTIATISDQSKLKDQPFFAKSSNGDKLLIYSQAKLAVLYSLKLNKIINVGPLSIDQTAAKTTK